MLKRAFAVVIVAAVLVPGVQAMRAWQSTMGSFRPQGMKFTAPSPLQGVESLTLKSSLGFKVATSWVPPRNGVAIVVAHGMSSNRAQLWEDARALTAAGFGVLLFDWPAMGESEGRMMLGSHERAAFTACVDFLASRPDVQRIGAYGFSYGASLLAAFVPDEPRVSALLAVNPWSDALEHQKFEYRDWGLIRQWPATAAAQRMIEHGNLVPLAAAPRLKNRKSLFIASAEDEVVPPQMSKDLAAAAGGELHVVPGASHFTFREELGDWPALLTGFFATVQN